MGCAFLDDVVDVTRFVVDDAGLQLVVRGVDEVARDVVVTREDVDVEEAEREDVVDEDVVEEDGVDDVLNDVLDDVMGIDDVEEVLVVGSSEEDDDDDVDVVDGSFDVVVVVEELVSGSSVFAVSECEYSEYTEAEADEERSRHFSKDPFR